MLANAQKRIDSSTRDFLRSNESRVAFLVEQNFMLNAEGDLTLSSQFLSSVFIKDHESLICLIEDEISPSLDDARDFEKYKVRKNTRYRITKNGLSLIPIYTCADFRMKIQLLRAFDIYEQEARHSLLRNVYELACKSTEKELRAKLNSEVQNVC